MIRSELIALAVLIAATILLIEALWSLDFAMWYRTVYSYYPWEWGKCYSSKPDRCAPLGDIVNAKYYQISISYLIAVITTYYLARARCPKKALTKK